MDGVNKSQTTLSDTHNTRLNVAEKTSQNYSLKNPARNITPVSIPLSLKSSVLRIADSWFHSMSVVSYYILSSDFKFKVYYLHAFLYWQALVGLLGLHISLIRIPYNVAGFKLEHQTLIR